jgi:hypothetical protein
MDGFRWQELFRGADSSLFRQQQHLKDPHLKEKYWREDVSSRREALLPFFWKTLAPKGQIYGNRSLGSNVNVTNSMWFSYPGYNEILTGKADDKNIVSNDKIYNPNLTVLEYINSRPPFKGKVAAFTSWDCFPYIINDKRSGVPVSAGLQKADGKLSERERLINELMATVPNPLGDVRLDAFTYHLALEYLKKSKPRVLYIAFDETDDFAHAGEYAAYLNSAHATDHFIGELWEYVESDAFYKGRTSLVITVDHGRGDNAEDWKHHGSKIAGADQIWLAVLGPFLAPRGEAVAPGQYYQNQVAATLAGLLGLTFGDDPGAGRPLPLPTASAAGR